MNFRHLTRVVLTLLAAWLAVQLCLWLRTPIPWMLGPLLVTAVASVMGAPTRSATPLRNAGQWVIGAALGLYFTPQVGALVVSLWWAIALAVLWALAMGALFGGWLQRQHAVDFEHLPPGAGRATCYFASAIGGASEMTLLAERHGARTDLVAASHSVRLVIVVLSVPFAMQWVQSHWGLTVDTRLLPGVGAVNWLGLFWLALVPRAAGYAGGDNGTELNKCARRGDHTASSCAHNNRPSDNRCANASAGVGSAAGTARARALQQRSAFCHQGRLALYSDLPENQP